MSIWAARGNYFLFEATIKPFLLASQQPRLGFLTSKCLFSVLFLIYAFAFDCEGRKV